MFFVAIKGGTAPWVAGVFQTIVVIVTEVIAGETHHVADFLVSPATVRIFAVCPAISVIILTVRTLVRNPIGLDVVPGIDTIDVFGVNGTVSNDEDNDGIGDYIQVGDNPGRREPTTGEIDYRNIFRHLHGRNFKGIVGMEHGMSRGGREGVERLVAAYRECDDYRD